MMSDLPLLTEDAGRHPGAPGASAGAAAAAAALTPHGIRTSTLYTRDAQTLYRETQKCTNIAHDKYQEFLRMFILYCSK